MATAVAADTVLDDAAYAAQLNLASVADMAVFDGEGKELAFGSLYATTKTIIVFV